MRNGITKNKKLLIDIWKMREVYILILLPVIWYIIFSYIPIYGLSLAFKTYKANLGIFGSPWVGMKTISMCSGSCIPGIHMEDYSNKSRPNSISISISYYIGSYAKRDSIDKM